MRKGRIQESGFGIQGNHYLASPSLESADPESQITV
jgi:hypothetical protein